MDSRDERFRHTESEPVPTDDGEGNLIHRYGRDEDGNPKRIRYSELIRSRDLRAPVAPAPTAGHPHIAEDIPKRACSTHEFMQELMAHTYFPSGDLARDGMKGAVVIGMSFTELEMADISRSWENARFIDCIFDKCSFKGLDMRSASMENCTFNRCVFSGSRDETSSLPNRDNPEKGDMNMTACDFSKSKIINSTFQNCSMPELQMDETWLVSTRLYGNDISNAVWNRTTCLDVDFEDNYMTAIKMKDVITENTRFNHNKISAAVVDGCRMNKTSISDSNISGTEFKNSKFLGFQIDDTIAKSVVFENMTVNLMMLRNTDMLRAMVKGTDDDMWRSVRAEGMTHLSFIEGSNRNLRNKILQSIEDHGGRVYTMADAADIDKLYRAAGGPMRIPSLSGFLTERRESLPPPEPVRPPEPEQGGMERV